MPNTFDVNSLVNLYDSDIEAIRTGPLAWMRSQEGKRVDLESFRKMAMEKFSDIGLRANVKCYDTNEPEVFIFEAEIQERLGKREFDYDRQVHEVQNDLLGLGEGGIIKADAAMAAMARKEAFNGHKGHRH
jgi:hypothetical protein